MENKEHIMFPEHYSAHYKESLRHQCTDGLRFGENLYVSCQIQFNFNDKAKIHET